MGNCNKAITPNKTKNIEMTKDNTLRRINSSIMENDFVVNPYILELI
jgi:hypothetical protein